MSNRRDLTYVAMRIVLLLLTATGVRKVWADPIYWVSYNTWVNTGAGSESHYDVSCSGCSAANGNVPQNLQQSQAGGSTGNLSKDDTLELGGTAANPVPLAFHASSGGSATASATLGSLGASVTATASVTPPDYTVDGVQYLSPFSAGADAFAEAQWMDTITVQSATLPPGTPVSFLAGLTLDDIPSLTGSGVLQVPGSGISAGLVVAGTSLSLQDGVTNPLYDQTATKVLDLSVGETFFVSGSLTAAVGIEADPFLTVSIDGSDTSTFFLTPLTPGATYSTASGMTYNPVPEVPEPSSILLLAPVLLALVVASRSSVRRRHL